MGVGDGLTNPKNNVESGSGSGIFSPTDREFAATRIKAQAVLEGRATFTFDELCRIVARLLKERG